MDARGREFQVGHYSRIVSLVPSWTESLFALGAGARVVAITDYCVEPRAAVASIHKIGGTKNPRVSEILALRPGLVIANVEENRKADVEQLEANGAPVFVTDARSIETALQELRALGELVGATNLEARIASIERECALARAAGVKRHRPRVFVAIWRDPWMTVNGDTFISAMLELAGGENVFRARERRFPLAADLRQAEPRAVSTAHDLRYPRVSVQEVIERAPEVILLPDEPYAFKAEDIAAWQVYTEIPAVQQDRVFVLDGKLLSWYGVRMGESLRRLRKLLNGNQENGDQASHSQG